MKTIPFWLCLGFFALMVGIPASHAQDSLKMEKSRKNIIRLNLTNPLIFGDQSLVLGYERVLSKNKSFSVNFGQASLPKFGLFDFGDSSTVQINKAVKDKGFNLTADFRFYLTSENRHNAPRGVYVGPYVSYVYMGRENTWTLNTESFKGDVKSDLNFDMFAVGGQLGYQFILWKRVALDLVLIGPGIALYGLEAKLDTSLDPDDESELYQKINEILTERFPGYSFAIDDVDFKTTGSTNVTSAGYRYVVHLGFNF
jgi:hypothetical protein